MAAETRSVRRMLPEGNVPRVVGGSGDGDLVVFVRDVRGGLSPLPRVFDFSRMIRIFGVALPLVSGFPGVISRGSHFRIFSNDQNFRSRGVLITRVYGGRIVRYPQQRHP